MNKWHHLFMQIVFCIIFRVWHCLSCTPTAKLSKLFYWHINKDQRANQRRKNNGETHTKRMWHDDGNERTKSNWFWNYCYKLNEDQMLCIVWLPENYSKISTIKWTAVMYSSLNVRNERSTHTSMAYLTSVKHSNEIAQIFSKQSTFSLPQQYTEKWI